MTIEELLARWESDPDRTGELVHTERIPPREPLHARLDPPLHPLLTARLAERGVERLYRHQVKAIRAIRDRVDTVVVAGTASGKTLCYQAPIAERALAEPKATSLLLYPTKALAQDQLRSFEALGLPELRCATYDGDTPVGSRAAVRRRSNVILTNPDMLHVGVLPYHANWADFLHRLEMVVVDEMHTLRGIFGTHVALILRRLHRLASHYGADPVFVFGSATIGNPAELAEGLCGRPVAVVDDDTSPRGAQTVLLWNPPVTDTEANRRRSSLAEATDVFCDLVRSGLNTIAFTRSRKGTELMYRWARDRLPVEDRERIAPYRAGYLPEQRRRIEARLFSGELLGVIATNALELGIDVGSLDAAVITTFPGTISGFRQQSGRAGRRRHDSVVTLVGGEDALDQYFMTHPKELFERPPESAVINPHNPLIVEAHVACAANERPLGLGDRVVFGDQLEEAANRLVQAGHLRLKDGALYWARRRRPAPAIDIRTSGGPSYLIVGPAPQGGVETLGTFDQARALRDGHEGAVYLHQGETFVVDRLDLDHREVHVTPAAVDYYTQPKEEKSLEVVEILAKDRIGPVGHHLGRVRVESQVVAYQRRKLGSRELIDTTYVDLPATVYVTQAIWLTIPDQVLERAGLEARRVPGALHAAEHAAIGLLPLMAVCDRWDIGGLSTPWHHQSGTAAIFIYEAYPGGAGISPVAFSRGEDHLRATMAAVASCPCASGCPSCVQSPKCGNFNEPLDKRGAVDLLGAVLARH